MNLTPYHAKYYANELTRRYSSNSLQKFTASLADAQVDDVVDGGTWHKKVLKVINRIVSKNGLCF